MVGQSLRAATFNIKHSATARGYLGRPWRLGQICAGIDADLLALQEVDRRVWRSWFADLVGTAQGAAYADAAFGQAMGAHLVGLINPGGRYGVALLVRGDILSRTTVPLAGDFIRLPFGRRRNVAPEPRAALLTRVRLPSGLTLSVATTHIGGPRRPDFVRTVAAELTALPGPRLLMGDLNAPHRDVAAWLAATSLSLAPRPDSLAEDYRQSDHIAVDGFAVTFVAAHWTAISDHPVVLADLTES